MNNAAPKGGAAKRFLDQDHWNCRQDTISARSPQYPSPSRGGGCPTLSPEEHSAICHEAAKLHRCGERPLAEFLIQLADQHGVEFTDDMMVTLGAYTHIPASVYRLIGTDRLPPPVLHSIEGACR